MENNKDSKQLDVKPTDVEDLTNNSADKIIKDKKVTFKVKLVSALVLVALLGIFGIFSYKNKTSNVEAGVSIGGSGNIDITKLTPGDLNHFAMVEPILYITLDESGKGLPAGFDYESPKVDYEISEIAKEKPNYYGAYIPSFMDSSLVFIPYHTGNSISAIGTNRTNVRKKVNLAWIRGIGDGKLAYANSKDGNIMNVINCYGTNVTSLDSKTKKDGVFYKELRKDGFDTNKWETLVTSSKIDESLKLWNYITLFSGNEFNINSKINEYIHFHDAEDDMERGYRNLDLLMTCYAMAKGSTAETSWKNGINNYIKSNGVGKDGSALGSNILIHTGVIYNNNHDYFFMTHMDAINFTMGMSQDGNMAEKSTAMNIVYMRNSKEAGLISTSSHNFNQRLREAYSRAVTAAPKATRTAWSGASTKFGSTIMNFILEKRPQKNNWMVMQDRSNPFIKRLYMPIYNKSGFIYRTTYGMNIVLSNAWVKDPALKMTAEVQWAKSKSPRLYAVPEESSTINQGAIIKLNFSTDDKAGWAAICEKYSKVAIAINVKRDIAQHDNPSNNEAKLSTAKPMKISVMKDGKQPTNYTANKFINLGESKKLMELLEDDKLTLDIFSDLGYEDQEIKDGEVQKREYDFEAQIMLYSGALGDPSKSFIYGDKDPSNTEVLEYKYNSNLSKSNKAKLEIEANKEYTISDPVIEEPEVVEKEKIYEYRSYISEPQAYSEIKEGTVSLESTGSTENYEAMAGVPSTEKLYFTSGGSEFIVEIYLQRIEGEETERKYTSWFQSNTQGCEFRAGDTLKGGTGKYNHTETFLADSDGVDKNKSVTAESSNIVTPNGASTQNITINGHTSSSRISAIWTGNISNSTSEPSDIGSFDPGKPGSPCPGIGYDPGTQRTKAEPTTSWDVSAYNTALNQAIQWATNMEATNSDFTVQRIADSDGQKRQWIIGDAVISVTMSGGSNGHSHTQGPGFGKNGTYTSSSASSAEADGTDKGLLGNGWGWTDGRLGTGSTSGCCVHGGTPHKEWDVVPKDAIPAVPPSYDEDGNETSPGKAEVPAVIGVKHAYNHSCSHTPGTDLTQGASATIQYKIEVTFKNSKTKNGGNFDGSETLGSVENTSNGVLAAHALCGPCCRHNTLPAVYDTWIQKLKYDYVRINAVNIYKISRSYVNGMQEITFDDAENVISQINRGDPNIFYNIAEESDSYSSDNPIKPSLAGRIRYSLQSQQHDEVIWREKSTDGDRRTNKCDGSASTLSGNAATSGGQGHKQKWANGILYNNQNTFTEDEEWFKNILQSTDKTTYSANSTDKVDEDTEEWKRFDERRNTKNKANIISDMLILQTSTGDQSVLYFTKDQEVTAQEHYGQDGELDASMATMWDSNPLSAANWSTTHINIGGYTGEFATPNNKFSTGEKQIPTLFDNNGSSVDVSSAHTDAKAAVAGPQVYSTVSNAVNILSANNYKSSPAKMQRRMDRVNLLKLVKANIKQDPTNPNKEYITGDAIQFYQNILSYKRGTYENARQADYKFKYENELDTVLGYEGYPVDAVYGPGFNKINNIVVHTPVSVQNATIVALPDARDQRAHLNLSAAESLMDLSDGLNYCPGTPESCDYRYLNCKYYQDVTLLSLNFEPKSTIATVGSDGSHSTKEIETVKVDIDEYGEETVTVVDTVSQLEYKLPDGFTIDKSNRFETGDSLRAYGTRLSIPLNDLGLSYKPSNRIQVEMNFFMPADQTESTMVVSFHKYDFYIPSGGIATWNTSNGLERRIDGVNFSGRNMKLKLVFSMSDVDDSEVWVDGQKVTSYTRVNASKEVTADYVGEFINIGSWTTDDNYPSRFYLDNLVITKLAGTHEHDKSCYTTIYNHQKFTRYACTDPVEFGYTGGVQTFTAPVGGWYKLETWGAQGGAGSTNQNLSSHAGLGGYAAGRLYLNRGETLKVNVGGQGTKSTALNTGGGYNGGGHGGPSGYGGGGATDIRIAGGNNQLVNGNFDDGLTGWGSWGAANRQIVTINGYKWLRMSHTDKSQYRGITQAINKLERNKDYTVSFKAYKDSNASDDLTMIIHQKGDGNNDPQIVKTFKLTTTPKSFTHNFKSTNIAGKTSFFMHLGGKSYQPFDIYITDIKFSVVDTNNIGLDDRILVAGGGGGADNAGGNALAGTGDDGSGGHGGIIGGNAYKTGKLMIGTAGAGEHTGGGLGYGGNQVGGYRKGIGESATSNGDTAGGGGGYWGGLTANHGNSGAGGGSSYTGGVVEPSDTTGVNVGNGKARITMLDHVHTSDCSTEVTDYNKHVHNKSCITANSAELVNALKLAEQGDYSLIKELLGNTAYNALKLPSQIMYTWSNWTNTDYKQFRELSSTKLSVSNGDLIASITGSNPSFDIPVSLQAASVEKIRVYARLVGALANESQMFFTNEGNSTYNYGAVQQADKNVGTAWGWVEFDVTNNANWRGNISGLRFDLAGSSSGRIEIDQIQLLGNGSAAGGTATKVLQTYSAFETNKKQFGITDGESASVTTFTGGNIVNSGNLTGMEFYLPVSINNADALQFIRVTMATDVGNYGGVYKNRTLQSVIGVGVNNGNGTHTVVYDVRHWDGAMTSIGFDTAHSTVTGTTRVSKIELIGYGNRTVAPTESYTDGAYDAHIHTQDCIYTPGVSTGVDQDFSFTGGVQTFTAPATGTYTLEVWGAQGGNGGYAVGGKGGCSKGTVTITKGETIYIYVGGQNGYNGGGGPGGAYGGGASDIRKGGITLEYRIIVAGGGGGAGWRSGVYGGAGGGTSGTAGNTSTWSGGGSGGTTSSGGSGGHGYSPQSAGATGSKGFGGEGGRGANNTRGGGGGGGYYGGGGGGADIVGESGSFGSGGGGGGSGYIGGVTSGQTTAGNASMPNPSGGTMTGKTGNGYARITLSTIETEGAWSCGNRPLNTYSDLVGTVTPVERGMESGNKTFNYTGAVKTFTAPATGTYTLEVWGAQGGRDTWDGNNNKIGGLGGYSKGTVHLNKDEVVYVVVGGEGSSSGAVGSGYNGGGVSQGHGSAGGGASHVARRTGVLSGLSANKSSVLLVAGGGGGIDFGGSWLTPTGHGGGEIGGRPRGVTGQATQTSGYAFGQGQNIDRSLQSGGGGGGWYGGYVGISEDQGTGAGSWGGGGSGYIGGVTGGTMQNGIQTGNGKATISWGGDVYYTGPNYVAPPNRYNYSYTPATIVYAAPSVVSSNASFGFGSLNGTEAGIIATINTISNYYNQVPQTIGGKLNPIFSCREVPNTHECVPACNDPITILTCTEPHHFGSHYDASNPICWSACKNDDNHKVHTNDIRDDNGNVINRGNFINTDYAFEVYFPNSGDFYQSTVSGIGTPTMIRGKGYVDNMDTTRWTREKRIMFTFDVLFYNEGTWEQYLAGDWIELPVTGVTYPYYKFYCTLNNNERAAADVYYESEAINAQPSPGGKNNIYARDGISNNDNKIELTNAMRFSNLTSYHGAFKRTYIDLVGRIGNLLVSDTDDLRFSNFFKTIKTDSWLVNGIINEVFEGDQSRYLSWHSNTGKLMIDIRGEQVDKATGMYNTWGTQAWTEDYNAKAKPLPLSPEKNNIEQLRGDPLKPGYSVLFEISTQGNYIDGLQILPFFYALNTKDGTLHPVDVWMEVGDDYKAINIHNLSADSHYWNVIGKNDEDGLANIVDTNWTAFKTNGLFDYVLNLDWVNEMERRNYDEDERKFTENVALTFTKQIDNGTEIVSKMVDVPLGTNYALGTLQLLNPKGRARTFIGNEITNTVNINNGTLTNLSNLIDIVDFNYKAQRWHLKLGVPSSAVFTKYTAGEHLHPTQNISEDDNVILQAHEEFANQDWVILMTADIKAVGDVWNIQYNQGINNGVISINGKSIELPSNIPTVLAVYDSDVTSTVDVDVIGTH